ncbi:MAG: hypothetical protein Fur0042_25320 [Cyanophyceae cyanobacterium]
MDFHPADLRSSSQPSASDREDRERSYQLFLSLYRDHRDLFEELAELDAPSQVNRLRRSTRYVQGIARGQQAYLITNLIDGKTRSLLQHQMIWLMGRDAQAALPIQDQRLSRRHAAIQYASRRGFYIVDLGSTNGSFVNGMAVHGRQRLQDGDRVRLGGFTFDFFVCHSTQIANSVPQELVTHLDSFPLPDDTESSFSMQKDALALTPNRANGYGQEATVVAAPEGRSDD